MSPRTVTIRLQADSPGEISFAAYNARTLTLACVGDVSDCNLLRAEIHTSRLIGATPVAAVEIDNPGATTNNLTFSAVEMNLLPENEDIAARAYYLVIYTREGTGDSAIRTTMAFGRLKLLGAPGSDIAAPGAVTSPFITSAELTALIGVTIQGYDADLAALAAFDTNDVLIYRSAAGVWSPVTIGTGLSFIAGVLSNTGGGGGGGGDIDIVVSAGWAYVTYASVEYRWAVAPGGGGSAAGTITVTAGYAEITYGGDNFRWPVVEGGDGSGTITVANGWAMITYDSVDYEWPVTAV
jgi:hypothetical protein